MHLEKRIRPVHEDNDHNDFYGNASRNYNELESFWDVVERADNASAKEVLMFRSTHLISYLIGS